jgi:DNA modification methylase
MKTIRGNIYNKDFRDLIKDFNKENSLIIIDPPYNINWKYDTYKDNLTKQEYKELFKYFAGFKLVVIHYIEDIIEYIVPTMGTPEKVVQWVYNSQFKRQHRSIAWFNCCPDFSKILQPYKSLNDKRIKKSLLNGNMGTPIYDWWYINLVKNVSKEKENYTNQIPEKVIGNIIKTTAKDEIIIDTFMGTGTTLAVASKLGFNYIGCDVSEKAYNITDKRLLNVENNLFKDKMIWE